MANIDGVNPPVLNDTDYVDKIETSFNAIDDHDHSAGKGLPIAANAIPLASITTVLADANKFLVRDGSGVPVSNTKAVPAGVVVGDTDTQTLTNKTLTAPVLTTPSMTSPVVTSGPITLPEISTPTTPSSGNGKIYFKSDGFLYQLNDDGTETKVGAGNSGINYITNPDAESNTTGWATYADAAASRPVDGTGGSANITFTRSTSSPLRGTASFLITKDAANRQGQGVSFDFTINSADQAKVLQIGFDYEIGSGTYSGGTSSTDSDLIAYIYRTTATGRLIEPTPIKLDGAVVGQKYQYRGAFQTDSDATGYRLIIHVATTSASAYTVKMDNVSVTPVSYSIGTLISDWVDQSSAFTLPAAFGTPTGTDIRTRRSGDSLEIKGYFRAGTVAASNAYIELPASLAIDDTKFGTGTDSHQVGEGFRIPTGAASGLTTLSWFYNGSTTNQIFVTEQSNAALFNPRNGNTLLGNNDGVSFNIRVPIAGWGSSVTVSNETDTRVVAMAVSDTTPTLASFTALTNNIVFDVAPEFDTHGAYSVSTGAYTVPVSGVYTVGASCELTGTEATDNRAILYIYKNGTLLTQLASSRVMNTGLSSVPVSGSYQIKVVSGDTISIRIDYDAVGAAFAPTAFNRFWVRRDSGPAQIAASEFVGARYGSVSTANLVTDTIIDYATKEFDTHNVVTTGASWKFTAPAKGTYEVSAQLVTSAASAGAVGNQYGLRLFKNGAFHAFLVLKTAETTTSCIKSCTGVITLQLNSTDTIDLRGFNSAGTHALNGEITQNFVCINKLDR